MSTVGYWHRRKRWYQFLNVLVTLLGIPLLIVLVPIGICYRLLRFLYSIF